MALPYRKWTEDEIRDRNVVPDGEYKFKIISVVLKKSQPGYDKNGNPKEIKDMLEIEFEFVDFNGVIRQIRDWIVFTDNMDWKLRHLADTTGTLEFYDSDSLETRHLDKKTGVFLLGSRENEYKGEKRKQNVVKDYVKRAISQQDEKFDDDITF
jgi:hypothetical protein